MTQSNARTGRHGEQIAADYLEARGYTILTRNWRCLRGEIDIIALNPARDTLVFVEVKTRHQRNSEAAFSAMSARKQERLIAAAHLYLAEQQQEEQAWRVDVIAVILDRKDKSQLEHAEDALGW